MSREVMQQALEALEKCSDWPGAYDACSRAVHNLRAALAEPEQEPVADDAYDKIDHYLRNNLGDEDYAEYSAALDALYTAPTPQREHITDGSPCWCNPDVFEEDGGNVIVHNYEDNWQQYAKPGETAQQCIERHRSEQDALMKLYATPRKPLTEKELDDLRQADGGALNFVTLRAFRVIARAIERAHGIGERT